MFRLLRPEKLIFLLFLFLGGPALFHSAPVSAQDPVLFPRPPELEPAINFWVRVYTEVDTRSGFLHDSRHLGIIYGALPLDRRGIEARRTQIQEDLRVLGTGKRDGLNQSQQEVLALWPSITTNETFQEAASNVRWQLGQSDRFLGGLRRSGAYRQHINQVIREKGLPIELGVLPHVESSFNPGALSSASAAGMWQFGRATGQRFMRIDHIVDERMDPYTASGAAMSLLEYNYSVLGTWPLALTAYNHGAGGIARAVRNTGTTDIETIIANYRGRAFGFASRNFYPQFLAVLQVENNARQHFGDFRLDPAPEFREVVTDAYIDAEVFASTMGLTLEQLRNDNRALRPVVWEGNKRIPSGFTMKVRQQAAPQGDLLAMIPADFKFPIQTPDIVYVVERGDSLSVIASRFNTSVGQLVSLNQLASRNRIQIGQRLLLPQDNSSVVIASASGSAAPSDGVYSVRRGDTVSRIASRFSVSETALLAVNGLNDPHRIFPGQRLTLPGFENSTVQLASVDIQPSVAEAVTEPAPATASSVEEVVELIPAGVASIESDVIVASNERVPEQLDAPLPAGAIVPDNQELDTEVSEEEGEAIALDPAVDVAQSIEQLSESLSADPSDYNVASNGTIEVQASETLGHYADWLGIRAWDVRRLNSMQFRDPVIIGERLRLDFSEVNIEEFELKRREFHSSLQSQFFASYRIQGAEDYTVRRNDNIGNIARNRYSTPVWLIRQYNPGLDFSRVQIGQKIIFPLLESVN